MNKFLIIYTIAHINRDIVYNEFVSWDSITESNIRDFTFAKMEYYEKPCNIINIIKLEN